MFPNWFTARTMSVYLHRNAFRAKKPWVTANVAVTRMQTVQTWQNLLRVSQILYIAQSIDDRTKQPVLLNWLSYRTWAKNPVGGPYHSGKPNNRENLTEKNCCSAYSTLTPTWKNTSFGQKDFSCLSEIALPVNKPPPSSMSFDKRNWNFQRLVSSHS